MDRKTTKMEMQNEPEVIYVCFWCGERFEVSEDVMVSFRIGIGSDGVQRYVPSCPKCASPPKEEKEESGYVH